MYSINNVIENLFEQDGGSWLGLAENEQCLKLFAVNARGGDSYGDECLSL